MKKILVVAQIPPPLGGQALMIQYLLGGKYQNAQLIFVPMRFSNNLTQLGRLSASKVLQPFKVICAVIWAKLKYKVDILYYAPSAPKLIPVLRDIILLIAIRPLFSKTIFHFHAAGIGDYYHEFPPLLKSLFRFAYFKPNLGISLSPYNPDDAGALQSLQTRIIFNGVPDVLLRPERARSINIVPRILYVGLICRSKGIFTLLNAIEILIARYSRKVEVRIVGEFASAEVKLTVMEHVQSRNLAETITFTGPLFGKPKSDEFSSADVFCYPSHFEAESFGLVVAEAMQHSLPVVAARWRGIQSLVVDGVTGYLVDPQSAEQTADRLLAVIEEPGISAGMGRQGRTRYEENFCLDVFHREMDSAFQLV